MKVGYIRTSKKDQNAELQRRGPEALGCEKFFEEQISSRKAERPQLLATLDYCRKGDALVMWELDCSGCSLQELIELVNALNERGVEFVSLPESLDARDRKGGRKPVMDQKKVALARKMMADRETSATEVAEALGVSKATLYRYVGPDGRRGVPHGGHDEVNS